MRGKYLGLWLAGIFTLVGWAQAQEADTPESSEPETPAAAESAKKVAPAKPMLPPTADGKPRLIPPPLIPKAGDQIDSTETTPAPVIKDSGSPAMPPKETAKPEESKPKAPDKTATAVPEKAKPTPAKVDPPAPPKAKPVEKPAPEKPAQKPKAVTKSEPKPAPTPSPRTTEKATPKGSYVVVSDPQGAFVYRFKSGTMIKLKLGAGEVLQIVETVGDRHRVRTAQGAEGYVKIEATRKASTTETRRFSN